MDSIERVAKTVDDAIAEALKTLNATIDEVEYKVLDPGYKGTIFGIGSKPARVLVTRKFDPVLVAKNFLREVTIAMGLSVRIETNMRDKHLFINMYGENMGIIIGKRGQTLDALQYLMNLVVNRCGVPEISVILDSENYRRRRRETLEKLSHNLARKVKETRQIVTLEPMSRFERHIIHTSLQYDRYVKTHSEGNEPFRNVIISPK